MSVTTSPETEAPEDDFAAALDAIEHGGPESVETPDAPAADPEPEPREEPAAPERAEPQRREREGEDPETLRRRLAALEDFARREKTRADQLEERTREDARKRAADEDAIFQQALDRAPDEIARERIQLRWENHKLKRERDEAMEGWRVNYDQLQGLTRQQQETVQRQQVEGYRQFQRHFYKDYQDFPVFYAKDLGYDEETAAAAAAEAKKYLGSKVVERLLTSDQHPDDWGRAFQDVTEEAQRIVRDFDAARVQGNRARNAATGRYDREAGGAAGGNPRPNYDKYRGTGNIDAMLAEIDKDPANFPGRR